MISFRARFIIVVTLCCIAVPHIVNAKQIGNPRYKWLYLARGAITRAIAEHEKSEWERQELIGEILSGIEKPETSFTMGMFFGAFDTSIDAQKAGLLMDAIEVDLQTVPHIIDECECRYWAKKIPAEEDRVSALRACPACDR